MRIPSLFLLAILVVVPMASACTGVVIAVDGQVWVGGNEDWLRDDAAMWAEAATNDRYGVVFLGYEIRGEWGHPNAFWYEFHGINDQGLYFDSFGAPCVTPTSTLGNPYRGEHLMAVAMRTCATVEQAVALFESTNLIFMKCQQFLFVDRSGAAAVVEGDRTVWMDQETLAVTNFYLSNPSLGGYPCWRYSRVADMLRQDATPSAEHVAALLEAASHSGTRYSVVCDLVSGTIGIATLHDFSRWATLDVAELCAAGSERIPLADLFAE